ncbi:YciI family protein [Ideonella paludis]|uniref:Transcription initiation protein n=1 Tax=Ideonella paludis TaxID=1233411 RepID=A0ABS5DT60_9BURK|nr:YciI family protein [Ideonella paludis]MBQ0934336.1 transcription initiation protein [Ideonella paludis]
MTHYLISFPASAMSHIPASEMPAVSDTAHAVIREAKAAGVYVFGGGIDESISPVMVTGEGQVSVGTYPETAKFNGGFCVVKVSTREEAEAWAAKIAAGCRCAQELRPFMFDPEC